MLLLFQSDITPRIHTQNSYDKLLQDNMNGSKHVHAEMLNSSDQRTIGEWIIKEL